MSCTELSRLPDHAIRVSRWSGACPDFFDFRCEQVELAGMLNDEFLGRLGATTKGFQVKNNHISRFDLPSAVGRRTGFGNFWRQPGTKRSAQDQAQLELCAHPMIIAAKFSTFLSTKVTQEAFKGVDISLFRSNPPDKDDRPSQLRCEIS